MGRKPIEINSADQRSVPEVHEAGKFGDGFTPGGPRRLSLRRNFAWTFVGNVVYAGCQWGMLVTIAKVGKVEMVGQFALALAITAPILSFSSLHLRIVQATDAKRDFMFSDYLGLRLLTAVASLVAVVVVILAADYGGSLALVIFLVGLAKTFETVSDVYYGLVQQRERLDRIAISMILKGAVSLVALGVAIYATRNLLWGVAALAAAWALVLGLYDVRSGVLVLDHGDEVTTGTLEGVSMNHPLRPRWETRTLMRLGTLALPLGAVMLLNSLATSVPRYFIEHYAGTRSLGLFAAMVYLIVAGTTVISALGDSASPRLAQYYAANDHQAFRNLMVKLVLLGVGFGIAGVLLSLTAGKQILTLIYRPEYGRHTDVLVWLSLAATVSYVNWFLGCGMTAARYMRTQTILTAAVLAVTAATCFVWIPHFGLRGAAWAILAGLSVQTMGASAIVAYALRTSLSLKNPMTALINS